MPTPKFVEVDQRCFIGNTLREPGDCFWHPNPPENMPVWMREKAQPDLVEGSGPQPEQVHGDALNPHGWLGGGWLGANAPQADPTAKPAEDDPLS